MSHALSAPPAPSWGRRLVGIEGLRAVAAVSVVAGHIRIHLAGDVDFGAASTTVGLLGSGLTLFFVLSGFLLYRPFAAAILGGRPGPNAGRFLRNRALRVYPAYVVIFLLSSFVLRTTYTVASSDEAGVSGVRETLGPITQPLKVLLDLTMLHTFWPGTVKTGLGAAWSLTTELTFYLVLPALAAVGAALARRRLPAIWAAGVVPVVLLVLGLAGKAVGEATLTYSTTSERFTQLWGANWHSVLERSLFVHADLFAYGAAAAVLYVLVEQGTIVGRSVVALRSLCAAAAVVVLLLLLGPGLPSLLGTSRWQPTAVAGALAALLLVVTLPTASGGASLLGRALELPPVRYTGLVSYSVYLWHLPVLWWLTTHGLTVGESRGGYLLNIVIVVGVTIALSSVTYYLVERPALRLKKRTDSAQRGAPTRTVESAPHG